jgi:hypothetical protein
MRDGLSFTSDEAFFCMNTGLVTDNQESIFIILHRTENSSDGRYAIWSVEKESSRRFVEKFGDCPPPLAEYFDDPDDLLFDRRLQLYIDIDHVMENISRFPEHLRQNHYMARQLLVSAQAQTENRVYRNYKTTIPQFFRDKGRHGKLQLLLPICLETPSRADLGLDIGKVQD